MCTFVSNQNIYKVDKTPEQLQEIFEWYAEWVTAYNAKDQIFWLCDNLNPKAIKIIVATYESCNN